MGILSNLFGTGDVIAKGLDLIDKKFPSDAQMIEAQTKAKTDLLTSYAPFKVAQRYLAVLFGLTFILSYILVLVMYFAGGTIADVMDILGMFKIDWIMLTIVGFYFGGGAFEGVVGKIKSKPS
ncbi:hypothetical protein [uncultured Marinobacter sp.]|uniref:hypothetical protein n=1 Tax=uncultured Marinobacter sp. TaxID=187379 RepID=UPI00259A7129|nr:hypothetical protein [uncultured Marinobacter sp.]